MWAKILGPIPDPPGFFRITATGRHHRVKRVKRLKHPGHPDKHAWVSVLFWCGNLSLGDRGTFSANRPYNSEPCDRCAYAWERRRKREAHRV